MKPTGYLAALPVGYILVKKCVIKFMSSAADASSFEKDFDQQSESSDGFLYFSHSSASRSSSDSSASTTKQAINGLVVCILRSQILGYIMQLTGKDNSQPFRATPDAELFIEDEDAHQSDAGTGPQYPVSPPPTSNGGRAVPIRHYDEGSPPTSGNNTHGDSEPMGPAHGVQDVGPTKPASHLIDALQTALGDSDVAKWLVSQFSGTKDELWAKLSEAFGKVAKAAETKPVNEWYPRDHGGQYLDEKVEDLSGADGAF